MNTPNMLTTLRMVLIPVYLCLLYMPHRHSALMALTVFALACLTDALDGYIARRDGLVTNFGKLMDPLADKLLVMAAMVALVDFNFAPAWAVVVILAREFLISLVRQAAAAGGYVIAADKMGKIKTISQMAWLALGMLCLWVYTAWPGADIARLSFANNLLCYITVALTALSGANYLMGNMHLFAMR